MKELSEETYAFIKQTLWRYAERDYASDIYLNETLQQPALDALKKLEEEDG